MRKSMLLEEEENKFQRIKRKIQEAKDAGIEIIDLSIGQPQMPASLFAREATSIAVMSNKKEMHSYQDNGCVIPGFPWLFVAAHMKRELNLEDDILPIPGIKSMLYVIPMACGSRHGRVKIATMTNPGYPTPKDACEALKNVTHYSLPLNARNKFLFRPKNISKGTTLVMTNFPNNPTGQIATKTWWRKICRYCEKYNIRIFNDAAYTMLASKSSCTLADVAREFPNLSWAEAYSASKITNLTGWRIGAIIGSKDFVADIRKEKGNFDSGIPAFVAAGALALVRDGKDEIEECRKAYQEKQKVLINILENQGMRLVLKPKATFFSFWHIPKIAFCKRIENAEHFNNLMIQHTGVVGVPFSPKYIRYCVTGNIQEVSEKISAAFEKAQIQY